MNAIRERQNHNVGLKNEKKNTEIPIVYLTYLNPIYAYGKEKFMKKSEQAQDQSQSQENRNELFHACNILSA